MSIVDNKVLDPKLVANVDADLQPTKKRIMGAYPMQPASWVDVYLSEHFPWVQP